MFHKTRVSNTWLESPELRAARVVDGDVRHFLYDMCSPLDVEFDKDPVTFENTARAIGAFESEGLPTTEPAGTHAKSKRTVSSPCTLWRNKD